MNKLTKILKHIFSFLLKFFLLIICCALFALIIVWPLWKWATVSPTSYSIVLLSAVALLIVFAIAKKIFYKVKYSAKS